MSHLSRSGAASFAELTERCLTVHPGDIRLVNAVDNSRLRHLVNVIIFSVKGDRDLPNQLGGGDLDGKLSAC